MRANATGSSAPAAAAHVPTPPHSHGVLDEEFPTEEDTKQFEIIHLVNKDD